MANLAIIFDKSTGRFISQLIGSTQLDVGAVTSGKLADNCVHLNAIPNGLLTSAKIAALAIGDGHITSGISANKLLSGYLGYKVTSGYPALGLTGQLPQARISGLFVSGLQLSGGIEPQDIRFLAGMLARPTPLGAVLDLDMAEGTGVGANEVDRIKALTTVYDKSGENNDGSLLPAPTEINACDLISDWLGTSGYTALSVDTSVKVEGTGAIKNIASGLVSGNWYYTRYNPSAAINLAARNHLAFWGRVEKPSTDFGTARTYITDTSGYYRYWDLTFTSGAWKKHKVLLSAPDGELSGIALANIDHIDPFRLQAPTSGFQYTNYIDYLIADDRPVFEDGLFGKALNFDGVDDYVHCGNDPSLRPDTYTIEGWVKPTNSSNCVLVSLGVSFPTFGVPWSATTLIAYLGLNYYRMFSVPDITNEWHHVAFVIEGNDITTAKAYLDGMECPVSKTVSTGSPASKDRCVIGNTEGQAWIYTGPIDKVRIYNRVLSADEIRGRYIQGLAKLGKLQGAMRLFTSGWEPRIWLDPESADLQVLSGAVRTSGQYYAGSQQVQVTTPAGYMTSAFISGGLVNGRIASGLAGYKVASGYPSVGLTGLVPHTRVSGLPYTNLNLTNSLLTADIAAAEFNVANKLVKLDASALVPDAQIPDIETLGYTNPFDHAQIPNLDATKIASGLLGHARISGLPYSNLVLTNSVVDGDIVDLAASKLTGLLDAARISGLAPSKIGSGYGAAALTGLLDHARISGLPDAQIADLAATKLTGLLPHARVSGLPYGNLNLANSIVNGDIVDLAATKLTGLLAAARISGLPYANLALSGRLANTDILSGISANKLLSGYLGYKVASGYPAVGLTGLVPYARISGFLPLAGGILTDSLTVKQAVVDGDGTHAYFRTISGLTRAVFIQGSLSGVGFKHLQWLPTADGMELQPDAIIPYARLKEGVPIKKAGDTGLGQGDFVAEDGKHVSVYGDENGSGSEYFQTGRAGVGPNWQVEFLTGELKAGTIPVGRLKKSTGNFEATLLSANASQYEEAVLNQYSFIPRHRATGGALPRVSPYCDIPTGEPAFSYGVWFHLAHTVYGGDTVLRVEWDYLTASGNYELWLGLDAEKQIRQVWLAEKPPVSPPIKADYYIKLELDKEAYKHIASLPGILAATRLDGKLYIGDLEFEVEIKAKADVPRMRRVKKTITKPVTEQVPIMETVKVFNEATGKWEDSQRQRTEIVREKQYRLLKPELGEDSPIEIYEVKVAKPLYKDKQVKIEEEIEVEEMIE